MNAENTVALFDQRPFFEKALLHGLRLAIIPKAKLDHIEQDAPKGLVQIAGTFGSQYLRAEIETARLRMVNLVSLYLYETAQADVDVAAKLIRDNTILTLSRGGSGLLKALFALPEYPLLGRSHQGSVEDFLAQWSLRSIEDYQQALGNRQRIALDIEAATWFAQILSADMETLREEDAEASSLIRSGLLILWMDQTDLFANPVEFAQMIEQVRHKMRLKTAKKFFSLAEIQKRVIQDIPETYQTLALHIAEEMIERDFPVLANDKLALDKVMAQLKDRYYVGSFDIEDSGEYDALVSKEWSKLTKGKTDIDSLITIFLCVACEVAPKTSISEKVAKSLIKKIRAQKVNWDKVPAWIKTIAPHEKHDGLIEDWHTFLDEAKVYLFSDEDDWDGSDRVALQFLKENCHITTTSHTL